MQILVRASIIIVGGLLVASSIGCGIVTIEPSAAPSTASASSPAEPEPPGSASARADRAKVDTRDAVERELLPIPLRDYGSVTQVEEAAKYFAAFKESRGKPAGDRIPGEVALARLRLSLSKALASQKNEALALYREARALATDVPPWAGPEDEGETRKFGILVAALGKLVDAARERSWIFIPSTTKEFQATYDEYKAKHAETPRTKALASEAEEIRVRFEKDISRWRDALARLEKDPEFNRLDAEESRLKSDAAGLRRKLGLRGAESGCGTTSPDPVDRQRLAALCPIVTRLRLVLARRDAIRERYLQGMRIDNRQDGKP
jgi:hypothetical protein